jgi:ubiquitin-like protein Pup
MATRDTGGQQRGSKRSDEVEEDVATAPDATEEGTARREKLSEDVDDLLDDIDEVLESNAEEWVKSFVQKGGE